MVINPIRSYALCKECSGVRTIGLQDEAHRAYINWLLDQDQHENMSV